MRGASGKPCAVCARNFRYLITSGCFIGKANAWEVQDSLGYLLSSVGFSYASLPRPVYTIKQHFQTPQISFPVSSKHSSSSSSLSSMSWGNWMRWRAVARMLSSSLGDGETGKSCPWSLMRRLWVPARSLHQVAVSDDIDVRPSA